MKRGSKEAQITSRRVSMCLDVSWSRAAKTSSTRPRHSKRRKLHSSVE